MIVEAPKYGASRRAAAISAPRLAAPTQKAIARSRQNGTGADVAGRAAPSRAAGGRILSVTLTCAQA
jgi:hypothetical protein